MSSPLVSVAQILPRKLALVVMLEHLLYIVPSKVNGKMHSWLGFWLINERLGDVLQVSGFAEKKEIYVFYSEKCPQNLRQVTKLSVGILLKWFAHKRRLHCWISKFLAMGCPVLKII